MFIPFIGNCPLFDWDEVNFAECAREMVVTGNYTQVQLNFQPFWEKPPFFIWLQALSMNLFGVNEFAARFPNAVCSIVSFIALYFIGKRFHSPKFGMVWCLVYGSLMLPHLYFKSGIIDPWFNLFIFLAVYQVILFINNPQGKRETFNALLGGFFLGMAVLTKGPAALLIVGLTLLITFLLNRNFKLITSRNFLMFSLTTLLVALSWFIVEWARGNGQVIREFIDYQIRLFKTEDAGHDGPFLYHFMVVLLGCFPASFIFIAGYFQKSELTPFQLLFRKVALCLFWVVILLFSIVKTKIVHYSSLCYYPLTFIATLTIVQYLPRLRVNKLFTISYWIIASIITLAFAAASFVPFIKDQLLASNSVDDAFARGNLQAAVHWSGLEGLIGIVFLAGSILIYRALKNKNARTLYYGFAACLVFIYTAILILIPKVEMYSQQAAISFYKECGRHHCYIETHSYRSYAYLFYSNRTPEDYTNPDQQKTMKKVLDDAERAGYVRLSFYANANCYWLQRGIIDRPAYVVAKKNQENEVQQIKGFVKLYELNGFCFFVRMP